MSEGIPQHGDSSKTFRASEGGTHFTLRVRRCEWCGHRCKGTVCIYHSDLPVLLSKHYSPKS